jgi:hypothetical protein
MPARDKLSPIQAIQVETVLSTHPTRPGPPDTAEHPVQISTIMGKLQGNGTS